MKSIISALFTLSALLSFGQSLKWVNSGAGDMNLTINTYNEMGFSVKHHQNNTYVVGMVTGQEAIISGSYFSDESFTFLANYSNEGTLEWLQQLEYSSKIDLAVDSKGEVLVTGSSGIFSSVRKYSSDGSLLWEKELIQGTPTKSRAVTVDQDDNIYLSGYYIASNDTLVVEDTIIRNLVNNTHSFVIKYDNNGSFQWIGSSSGGGEWCELVDIETDSFNNVYAIGSFLTYSEDSITFEPFSLQSTNDPSDIYSYYQDAVVIKYNSNGHVKWVNNFGGFKDDFGNNLSTSNNEDIFITGTFTDTAYFLNHKLISQGNYDIFICKVNEDGDIIWAESAGGEFGKLTTGVEAGRSVSTNHLGDVFISGTFLGKALFGKGDNVIELNAGNPIVSQAGYLAKYSEQGNLQWAINIFGRESRIQDISCHNESIFMAGNFYSDAVLLNEEFPVYYSQHYHFFVGSVSDTPSSIFENRNFSSEKLFPNPAHSKLYVHYDQPLILNRYSIYNFSGQLVLDGEYSQENGIDIQSINPGIYFLQTNEKTLKFIKNQ